jgi:large subunit ribosomal protein L32e
MKAEVKSSLKLKRKQKRKKPSFQRQEGSGRIKKLKKAWRRPRGRHSKLRQKEKARGRHPGKGYGSPKQTRGLTRAGLKEVRVSNPSQLEKIDPKAEAVVISGSVGKLKRKQITEKAEKQRIRVLNA